MNKCISSSNILDISNAKLDISNAKLDISNAKLDISNINFDISYDASYSIKYKTTQPKPKRTLIQKIIKLNTFFCYQVATILVATLILSSLCKCYDVLIYFSFGSFISILFIGSYALLLKFQVFASREFNEKYNNTIFNLWKKYVPLSESLFFICMAVGSILTHIFLVFLALYYVKGFITNSITTNYSYISSYIALVLLYVMNYNSGFKLYNNSLKMTIYEYNLSFVILLSISVGVIYYFETIKSKYLNTNCL
jgi:hypothetical protein